MVTAAAFALFTAACTLLALVRHPIFGLYLYLAVVYVHPPSRWWGSLLPDLRWSLFAAAVTAIAIVVHRKKLGTKPVWLASGPAVLLTTYTAWLWLQTAWALDLPTHLEASFQFTKYLIAYWFVYRLVDSKEGLRNLLLAHVLGCCLLGVFAYFGDRSGGRLDGVGGPGIDDANTLGMYFVTGALAAGGLILSQKGWRRYASLGCMAMILNGFVLANSRGALLGLLAGGLVFAFCKAREHRPLFWSLALVGCMSVGVIVDQAFVDRMFSIRDAVQQDEEMDSSSRSRVELYHAQLQMFADHPMGSGHRGTAVLSPLYLDREWLSTDKTGDESTAARSSHNTFMTALVEQGLPGAVLFVAQFAWLLATIVRVHRWGREGVDAELTTHGAVLCGALLTVFVAGIATDYLKAEVQFWLYAALVSVVQLRGATPAIRPSPASPADRQPLPMMEPR